MHMPRLPAVDAYLCFYYDRRLLALSGRAQLNYLFLVK